MRRRARIDSNQPAVVRALRQIGCGVAILAPLGGGIPDLLVGHRGRNVLMEVKDGDKPPSERQLTMEERAFHATWPGDIHTVETPEQAVRIILGRAR